MLTAILVLQGVLVTYKAGVEIGRERYHDDGATLTSEISLGELSATVKVSRSPRHVTLSLGEHAVEHDLPPGTIVLENGAWQEYSLAAEWFPKALKPTPVKALVPAPGKVVDATIAVTPLHGGGKKVSVTVGQLEVFVELSRAGVVRRASVPAQQIEVRPEGEAPPAAPKVKLPGGVVEELVEVKRGPVTLRGVVWRPGKAKRPPLVVIIAGSGPTDRDGNSGLGLRSDLYKQLAVALAKRGVATLRYDKRGVGGSSRDFDPATLVIGDFADDAAAIIGAVYTKEKFASLTLAGHSEGGLLATMIADQVGADGLALLAAGGRPVGVILREQIATKIPPDQLAALDSALSALREGRSLDSVPPELMPLFPPSARTFLKSELDLDPAALLRSQKLRGAHTVIIQGEHDAQITGEDARLLKAARPDAKLVLLPTANHLFKEEPSRALPQASYTDPARPLVAGIVDALLSAVKK